MPLRQPPFAALFLLSAAVSALIALYSIRRRENPGAIPLAAIMAAGVVWAVGYTLELALLGFEAKLFWWQVKYLGVVAVPTFWLLFALEYGGFGQWITRRTLALLSVVPTIQVIVVWTNQHHHLYVGPPSLETRETFVRLMTPTEPGFWVFVGYHYLLLLLGAVLMVRLFLVSDDLYRGQAVAILLGVAAPFVANILFLFRLIPGDIDFSPVAFTVTGVAFTWAVFRHELLEIAPVTRELAREELIDSIADATFVVDEQRRVVDLNPAARDLVTAGDSLPLGRRIQEVLPEIADLFEAERGDVHVQRRIERPNPRHTRYFDIRITSLARGYGLLRGHIVIMRDVTDLERHRQRLEVMNRVLRHDIRNDVNLILAYADEALDGTEDLDDRLERIKAKARDITELGDNARVLERTPDGEVAIERIELVSLVEDYLTDVRQDYPDVDIETDLPPQAYVLANPLVESALKNVVENAIEHHDRQSPTIQIGVHEDASDGLVELRVADNGPGIPAEEREVIERGAETQVKHSSGLGLWLVNWIVTESGGEVRFADNHPRGTVTTIVLNAADASRGTY